MKKLRQFFRSTDQKQAEDAVAAIDDETTKQSLDSEPPFVGEIAIEPQTHLDHYLHYYVRRSKPRYAVLVTGEWGTGKTTQVRDALPERLAHYVSLYGLHSADQLEAAVFAKMFPVQAKVRAASEKISQTGLSIPGLGSLSLSGLPAAVAGAFIKQKVNSSKPIILDDLERSKIPPEVILGVINRYVEHDYCRVVVIAHDKKLLESFDDAKEKVFGQTIEIEPNLDKAFEAFTTEFNSLDVSGIAASVNEEVLTIFKESQTPSLRILRHAIEDLRRMINALEDKHRSHRAAMVELTRLFTALSIEMRSGRLKEPDLLDRGKTLRTYRFLNAAKPEASAAEPPPIVASQARYKSVDLTSTLLHDDALVEMLVKGNYEQERICHSVNTSAYFVQQEEGPSWQVVINFDKLDDDVVEPALARMESEFANRAIRESGDFLHVVALKMLLAFRSISTLSVEDVVTAAKAYIDDQLESGQLPPRPAQPRWDDAFRESFAGVGYWVNDGYRSAFDEVFKYLVNKRGEAFERQHPAHVAEILDVLGRDGQAFFALVCHTGSNEHKFADLPILTRVPVKKFVDVWLASPKTGWYWVGNALKERRNNHRALTAEFAWHQQVAREMGRRATSETGLAKLRIERAAGWIGLPFKKAGSTPAGASSSRARRRNATK